MTQIRQTPLGICLISFTVVNLFRYMHPVMTDRTSVILYFRFPASLAVCLDVLVQRRDFLFLLHSCITLRLQRYNYFSGYCLFGFLGNHPFNTRSSCSNTSLIVQNEEKANTPQIAETKTLSISKEATVPAIPRRRNIHQHFVPQ